MIRKCSVTSAVVLCSLLLLKSAYALPTCGRPPLSHPTCEIWVCNDGDTAWSLEPQERGTSCTTKTHGAGQCDGNGSCGYFQSFWMHGIPISLLYVPPGKQSSVSYGTGSSEGSIFQMQFQSGSSNTVQLGFSIFGNGVSGNSQYVTGTINGRSTSITKTTTSSVISTNAGNADFPDHGYDTLFIWANPATTIWLLESGTIVGQSWQTSDSGPINVVPFTMRELNGTDSIPDNVKRAYFNNFTPTDKSAFVALDPFV